MLINFSLQQVSQQLCAHVDQFFFPIGFSTALQTCWSIFLFFLSLSSSRLLLIVLLILAGSIHPPFRLNFLDPAHLYSSTTLLSSNNERASHLLVHHRVLHQDKSIRTSTLRVVTTCHNREKEKKRKEPAKLKLGINEGIKQARRRRSLHLSFLDTQNYSRRRNGSFSRIPKEKHTLNCTNIFLRHFLRLRVEFRPQNSQDRCSKTTAQCKAMSLCLSRSRS